MGRSTVGAPDDRTRLAAAEVRRLVALARKLRIARADDAAGMCLSTSLQFALMAHVRCGIAVQLVKWRVRNDPAYVDHWAVRLDDTRVLDLTRSQVDGSARLVVPIDDYPPQYVHRRIYPARLLVPAYAESAVAAGPAGARLPKRFLWRCGTALFRFDARAALQARDAGLAWSAAREFVSFAGWFGVSALTRSLEQRADRLLQRLRRHCDLGADPRR